MESKALKIMFEGQSHQIEANTLINILVHYNSVIMAANQGFGDGTKNISIKVNALKEGSFIIDLSVVSNLVSALFSSGSVDYVANLITITQGVFRAYKELGGHPARTEEDKSRISIKGASITINQTIHNVYNAPLTREAISKSIATASDDVNVEGIVMTSEGNEDLRIERSMFTDLIYDDFDDETETPEERTIEDGDACLTITSLSFKKNSTWTSVYKGFEIRIKVKDDALWEAIVGGTQFGKGDAMRARLGITQKYDPEYKVYKNKSYRILEFHELIKARYDTATCME